MEISKMLTISTAHITKETADLLNVEMKEDNMWLCVYNKENYGWFIHVPDDLEDLNVPDELMKCLLFAKDIGCDWLCLDCDGEVLPYLHQYNW